MPSISAVLSLIIAVGFGHRLFGQAPVSAAGPTFEVASVKRNMSGSEMPGLWDAAPGGRWTMINGTVRSIIAFAYTPGQALIVGLPSWAETERYDVTARADRDAATSELRWMVRSLLAERFAFRMHYETRRRSTYALMLARADGSLGPQIRKVEVDCPAIFEAIAQGTMPFSEVELAPNGARRCSTRPTTTTSPRGSVSTFASGGTRLDLLLATISGVFWRPVVDKTGLQGYYEFTLRYARTGGTAVDPDDAPSIFAALREQLGFKLESEENDIPVFVVDRLERPTPD